jgi:hypothetical protein
MPRSTQGMTIRSNTSVDVRGMGCKNATWMELAQDCVFGISKLDLTVLLPETSRAN